MRVKCLAQEHKTMSPQPGLKPRLLDPGMSALTMRPPRLPHDGSMLLFTFITFYWDVLQRGAVTTIFVSCKYERPSSSIHYVPLLRKVLTKILNGKDT